MQRPAGYLGLFGLGLAGFLGTACGTSVNLFSDGSVGAGGTGAGSSDGGSGGSMAVTTTGGGEGGMGTGGEAGCNPADCEVDALCFDGVCGPDDECIVEPSPAGTSCGVGFCDGMGNCQGSNGTECSDAIECISGFCVDGVCCDAACDGECSSCASPGAEGSCTPYDVGTDPEMECSGGSCTGSAECATGLTVWASTHGNNQEQLGHEVDVDSAGNLVVTGYHYGSIDFGGNNLNSSGFRDLYLAKLDPMGNHIWSQSFGDASSQFGWDVVVGPNDDIVVGGYFYGQINLGGGNLNAIGQRDSFIARFDAAGNHLFSARYGGVAEDLARTVAIGPAGQMAIAGYFEGAINFGGNTLNSAGNLDAFVAVFDAAGNHTWSQSFGAGGDDRAYDVAFDASGNLYVGGRYQGSVDFGGGVLTSAGSTDAFLAKFDTTGGHLWSQRYGNNQDQYLRGIAVDPNSGDVVVAGYANGSINLGGTTLTSQGGSDIYVAKLTAAGAHVWSAMYAGSNDQFSRDLDIDPVGNIVFTGYGFDSPDFGGGPLPNAVSRDAFVVKLNPDGVHLWSRAYGGNFSQYGHGIAVDATGHVAATGYFSSSIDFGMGPVASNGQEDVFIMRLAP